MASTYSFDIVSDFDLSELHNVIDQTKREIATRYDFKGTSADVVFDPKLGDGGSITVSGDNQFHLDSIADIIRKKMATRNISQKTLNTTANEPSTTNMIMKWIVPLKKGLSQENAKIITKQIRDKFPKAKPQIQGDEVRVTSASKDELQAIMQDLQAADFDFPLSFTNYR